MLKRATAIVLVLTILAICVACSSEKDAGDVDLEENVRGEENSVGETNQTADYDSEDVTEKEEMLYDYSNVQLLLDHNEPISENEMLWCVALNEQMLLQTDLTGKIYNSYPREDASHAKAALTENRILFQYDDYDYYIYDFENDKDVTDEYTGGDKKICYANKECIICIREEETYNSQNIYIHILDAEGNEILSFSTAEMSEKYNVEWERNWEYGACGSHIYYIQFDNDKYCFVDLERKKVYVSLNLPMSNSGIIRSDGEYILDCQPHHGQVVINCETEEISNIQFSGTVDGLSEGKLYGEDRYGIQAYLNVDGSTAIELNYENTSVTDATQFENGYAMVEFNQKFTTIIDGEGNFLFEPVEGTIVKLLDLNGSNAYIIHKDMAYYLLDETGNISEKISEKDSIYPLSGNGDSSVVIFENNSFSVIPIK